MSYTIINVKDYGVKGDGVTPDNDALQLLINNVSRNNAVGNTAATKGDGVQLFFPPGVYVLDAPLYLSYDDPGNLNFNKNHLHQGKIIFIGSGCGDASNATFTNTQNANDMSGFTGTVLKFTDTTRNGLILSTEEDQDRASRNVVIKDMAIYGATSGHLVEVYQTNTTTTFERIVIYNNNNGIALYMSYIWNISFRSILILGNGSGTGARLAMPEVTWDDGAASGAGGGNQTFQDVFVSNFEYAYDFGNAYTSPPASLPDTTSAMYVRRSYRNITLIGCTGTNSKIGMRLRFGIAGLVAINLRLVGNEGDSGGDLEITDAAGYKVFDADMEPGNLCFMGSSFSSSATSPEFVNVRISRQSSGAKDNWADSAGPISFQGSTWNSVTKYGIRRFNNLHNQSLIIDGCSFQNNGGYLVCIENELQHGPLIFTGHIATSVITSRYVVTPSKSDMSKHAFFYIPGFNSSVSNSVFPPPTDSALTLTGSTGNVITYIPNVQNPTELKQIMQPLDSMVLYIHFMGNNKVYSSYEGIMPGFSKLILSGNISLSPGPPGLRLTLVYNKYSDAWLEVSRSF